MIIRTPGAKRRLAKKRIQCLNKALSFISSSVLEGTLSLRYSLFRLALKRYKGLS